MICTRTVADKQEKVTMVGEECDLLGIVSPYTYIVKQKTLCYVCPVESFYKVMLDLNPLGLEDLKAAAASKLKEYCTLTREKKEWDSEVAQVPSIKCAEEKLESREAFARKNYPIGDKPVIQRIMNIIQNKQDLGETQRMKNVEQRRTTGAITHDDIMRIERLRNEVFPDYDFLNRVLEAQKSALKNKMRPPHIKDLIRQAEAEKAQD